MTGPTSRSLIVVGQGAAGLTAALAAAEAARGRNEPIRITLIDKASEAEAGGNTLWSPSNMRMAAPDRVEPSFVQDMLAATNFRATKPISRGLQRKLRRRSSGSHRTASNSFNRPIIWRKAHLVFNRLVAVRSSSKS